MNNIDEFVRSKFQTLSDENYKAFHAALIPSVPTNRILGVRTPILRRFAREFGKSNNVYDFMYLLPHTYYEENNLHAFLIEQIKDYDKCVEALDIFLPYVDNWATCDMMSPKILSKEPEQTIKHIDKWLASSHVYEVRFGIVSLMRYFLEDNFKPSILYKVSDISSDEYYINMARAWFFATAMINHYDEVYEMLVNNILDTFTHNKTIQKAIESYRISKEQKVMLRQLKRK